MQQINTFWEILGLDSIGSILLKNDSKTQWAIKPNRNKNVNFKKFHNSHARNKHRSYVNFSSNYQTNDNGGIRQRFNSTRNIQYHHRPAMQDNQGNVNRLSNNTRHHNNNNQFSNNSNRNNTYYSNKEQFSKSSESPNFSRRYGH